MEIGDWESIKALTQGAAEEGFGFRSLEIGNWV